ncbi:MAG: GNAT family N-acetyltransferase [Methanospirillum sp.]
MELPFTLSTDPPVTVRRMSRDELGIAIDLAGDEGWNPGLYDAETFWEADPGGFFALEHDGRVIGTVSVVRYGDGFAFGGLYVLLPEYRGRGIGYALQQEFTLPFAGSRNLGIDGVFGMRSRYASAGFLFAHRNVRFEGSGGGGAPAGVIPLEEMSFEAVADYDRPFFPGPREAFLRAFLSQPDAIGYAVASGEGDLAGYGLARPCRTGYKVGPLFADTPAVAERLFRALSAAVPGEPVFLDVPEPNGDAVALAARHGMREVFGTARMYSRSVPALPLDRIYGITTFELG